MECVKARERSIYYPIVRDTDYLEDRVVKYESIGRHIQQERKARKMTQSVLAEKASVSTKYISNIECGEKLPRLETFIAIANAIGTDANTLLSDVLEVSAEIKSSSISEKIAGLPPAEQKRILRLLNAMVDEAQENH